MLLCGPSSSYFKMNTHSGSCSANGSRNTDFLNISWGLTLAWGITNLLKKKKKMQKCNLRRTNFKINKCLLCRVTCENSVISWPCGGIKKASQMTVTACCKRRIFLLIHAAEFFHSSREVVQCNHIRIVISPALWNPFHAVAKFLESPHD